MSCEDLRNKILDWTIMYIMDWTTIRSNEGPTLKTAAFVSLYGGKFILSTQLIKPNYLVILPTDAAPQFSIQTYPLYLSYNQSED